MKPLWIGIVLAGWLAAGCGRNVSPGPGGEAGPPPASPREIPLLLGEGTSLDLNSLRGRVVLLDFCATWSVPSRMGVKGLNELHAELSGSGLTVLGMCVDEGEFDSVSDRVSELGARYDVAWADRPALEAFGGIRPIPTRIVLDRDGTEVRRFEGATPLHDLEAVVRRLLDSAVSPRS